MEVINLILSNGLCNHHMKEKEERKKRILIYTLLRVKRMSLFETGDELIKRNKQLGRLINTNGD